MHIQRRLQAWVHHTPYRDRYRFIPLNQISPNLQHAVIAAEDGRFYQHHGFDWQAMELAADGSYAPVAVHGGAQGFRSQMAALELVRRHDEPKPADALLRHAPGPPETAPTRNVPSA